MADHDPPPPGADQTPPGGPPPPGWPPPGDAPEYGAAYGGRHAGGHAGHGAASGPTTGGTPGAAPPQHGIPWGRPLHKPGTVPLRPLTLTDFFDGAFTTIRRNPRATIGVAVLVTAGFMVLPAMIAIVLGVTGQMAGVDTTGDSSPFADAGVTTANSIASIFGFLAGIVVTGLVTPVVTRAVIGDRLTAGQAWQQAKGRLVRLLGLALLEGALFVVVVGVPVLLVVLFGVAVSDNGTAVVLTVLVGLVVVLLALCAALAIHVRWFQLAAPVVVVERRGVFEALRRSGRLARGQFWRILGVFLLAFLATVIVNQVIAVPFALLGAALAFGLQSGAGTVGLLLSSNVASVLSGAIVGPFAGAIAVLQYVDQRFRKEGFDIELVNHVQSRRQS
jgi:hypothetical protein